MATLFKLWFRAKSAITITLNSLANGGIATSNDIDNSANLDDEIELEINVNGTASATAWLDVRLLKSIDGGVTYDTWESATVLPPIILSATPQVYHARFNAPEHFKIAVKNNTGAVLGGTNNTANYQGIQYQGA